jgi:hypothetical protein
LPTANDPVELFPGTILQTREATQPNMTKSPQPPNSAECALSTAEVKQLHLQSYPSTTDKTFKF